MKYIRLALVGWFFGVRVPAAIALGMAVTAAGAPPLRETLVYKRVGALEIKADVYRPAGEAHTRPVFVYFHGGSLINGGRQQIEKHPFKEAFLAAGFVVVSPDYRLAPESKVPAIIEDLEDLFLWIRERGPALFGADPVRLASGGGSAGGYLTLVAGYRVQPRPFAMIAEMSYGDLIGAWQLRPSIHPPHYTDSRLDEAAIG